MEAALGMSYAGKRALCCMKHVGLNVAADCFMNAAMSGVNGGMIIITADDPSMHSSQNEQDNRMYGNFAMIPMLEPASQQEAYDMVYDGFELSEKLGYPVLVRITTRMAHSRAGVVRREQKVENKMHTPEDGRQRFILLPALARKRFKTLIAAQDTFTAFLKPHLIMPISTVRIRSSASSRPVFRSTIFRRTILTVLNIRY